MLDFVNPGPFRSLVCCWGPYQVARWLFFGGRESCGKRSPDQVHKPNMGLVINFRGDTA